MKRTDPGCRCCGGITDCPIFIGVKGCNNTYMAGVDVILMGASILGSDVTTAGRVMFINWSGPGSVTGSGFTNGTHYPLVFSGGGASVAATGEFDVSFNGITAIRLMTPGAGYTSAPTLSFAAAGPGTGVSSITATIGPVAVIYVAHFTGPGTFSVSLTQAGYTPVVNNVQVNAFACNGFTAFTMSPNLVTACMDVVELCTGRPFPGRTIQFTTPVTGATASCTTNSGGHCCTTLTVNRVLPSGVYPVNATVTNVPVGGAQTTSVSGPSYWREVQPGVCGSSGLAGLISIGPTGSYRCPCMDLTGVTIPFDYWDTSLPLIFTDANGAHTLTDLYCCYLAQTDFAAMCTGDPGGPVDLSATAAYTAGSIAVEVFVGCSGTSWSARIRFRVCCYRTRDIFPGFFLDHYDAFHVNQTCPIPEGFTTPYNCPVLEHPCDFPRMTHNESVAGCNGLVSVNALAPGIQAAPSPLSVTFSFPTSIPFTSWFGPVGSHALELPSTIPVPVLGICTLSN